MNKRKVLMTASVWTHIRNFHIPYLRAFQQLGWETHVACAGMPKDAPCVDVGIDVSFEKRMTSPANFRAARLLRRRICDERYDLIITHTTLASFFTRMAVKGMRNRAMLVNVMHGYLFDDETSAIKRAILLGAEKLTVPQTDLLLVMNEWDRQTAERYHLSKRIEMIPGMGVDFSMLDGASKENGAQLKESLGIRKDAFVLLYAAEFTKRKNQCVLIQAMKALPRNVVLVLCGNGIGWEKCRSLASELGLSDRILFPSQVENMPVWYRMADVCVSSSRSEGLPFNVMEAMHIGLPVVASAVKGHVDLIEEGQTGLLYPCEDADALAAQVLRLLQDEALRNRIAAHAIERSAGYSAEIVRPIVMRHYLSVVQPMGEAEGLLF